ncbi:hypothetical protein [Fundidesulfovibrio putealis]|uniref:hypothetical protein n=1 Tax=Fundidesulfovibrio putealis TaxID=270496 RepID=UPI0012EB0622|nr:hypothetical protein [Fundidesulfovibrio putealis]
MNNIAGVSCGSITAFFINGHGFCSLLYKFEMLEENAVVFEPELGPFPLKNDDQWNVGVFVQITGTNAGQIKGILHPDLSPSLAPGTYMEELPLMLAVLRIDGDHALRLGNPGVENHLRSILADSQENVCVFFRIGCGVHFPSLDIRWLDFDIVKLCMLYALTDVGAREKV